MLFDGVYIRVSCTSHKNDRAHLRNINDTSLIFNDCRRHDVSFGFWNVMTPKPCQFDIPKTKLRSNNSVSLIMSIIISSVSNVPDMMCHDILTSVIWLPYVYPFQLRCHQQIFRCLLCYTFPKVLAYSSGINDTALFIQWICYCHSKTENATVIFLKQKFQAISVHKTQYCLHIYKQRQSFAQ